MLQFQFHNTKMFCRDGFYFAEVLREPRQASARNFPGFLPALLLSSGVGSLWPVGCIWSMNRLDLGIVITLQAQ